MIVQPVHAACPGAPKPLRTKNGSMLLLARSSAGKTRVRALRAPVGACSPSEGKFTRSREIGGEVHNVSRNRGGKFTTSRRARRGSSQRLAKSSPHAGMSAGAEVA